MSCCPDREKTHSRRIVHGDNGNTPLRRLVAGVALLIVGAQRSAGIGALTPEANAQDDSATLREVGVIAEADETLTSLLADCTEVAALLPASSPR